MAEEDKPQTLRKAPVPPAIGPDADAGDVTRHLNAMSDSLREQQEHTAESVDEVRKSPLVGGNEITFEFSGAGTLDVAHKLGRAWSRWIVVGKSATADVWEASQTANKKFLSLEADAAVTVKVVVS